MREAVRYGFTPDSSERTVEKKISRFRRSLVGYSATGLMLFGINAVTAGPPWFIFPTLGMMVALAYQLGSLWGDGASLGQVFFGPVRRETTSEVPPAEQAGAPSRSAGSTLVNHEVLQGPHGAAIQRAMSSQQVIADLLRRMTAKEREMLPPDVEGTVKALVERVAAVGMTLHRLDSDANGGALGTLDARIDGLKRESPPRSSERERRIALLERQRATLHDLLERRSALLSQLESASLALENLKLDLVRFRSAGVSSALEDVTSATREARAVSRDIGHLLDAQDEVKRL